jgi:hypothetical protein
MRLRRREAHEEPPRERVGGQEIFPDRPRRPPPDQLEPELSTAAERAAARRRLDRLAEEF